MARSNATSQKPTESLARAISDSGSPEPLSPEEFKSALRRLIDDTDDFIEDDISPVREKAWRYFNARTDLATPPKGRSQVVMSEVRDVVEATMPSLMRIFTSTPNVVEFLARTPDKVRMAEQSTDSCNYCFWYENPGWEIMHDAFKSGLVARTAAAKAYWTNEVIKERLTYSGLNKEQYDLLLAEKGVELVSAEEVTDAVVTASGEELANQVTYDCIITREKSEGRIKVEAIPPEEFVIDRRATSHRDALLIGQRTELRVTDLVEMQLPGVTYEDIVALAQEAVTDEELEFERESRTEFIEEEDYEDTQDQTKYVPTWDINVRIDMDGDGIAEWRHVIACGEPVEILFNEPADGDMFVAASPIRVPHTNIGRGQADLTMDLQDIATHIVRQTLDNITNVNNPRKEIVENQVNMIDVLDNRFNGVIRTRAPGMIRDFVTPFVGDKALPILDYIEHKQEMRTGISKQTMGLDADALQSMAETGVRGTLGAAQQKIELIARTYAELFVAPLFRLIQRLYIKHQDTPKMLRLRGEYAQIDPRSWNSDLDVQVNVGLGSGTTDEKVAALMAIKAAQEQILMQMGPQNPVCSLEQYSHTLSRLTELSGNVDAQSYFNPPEKVKEILPKWQEAQAKAQGDDGKAQEAQAKAQEAQAKMQLEQQKAQQDFQIKKAKMEAEITLEREKAQQKLQLEREIAMQELALKREEMAAEAKLSAMKISHGMASAGDTDLRNPQ